MKELRDYLPNIPWHRIARACTNTVAPVCTAIRDTVHYDVDSLARLLVDLETFADTESEMVRIVSTPIYARFAHGMQDSAPKASFSLPPPSLYPSIALGESISGGAQTLTALVRY